MVAATVTVLWTSGSPADIAEAIASGMSAALGVEVVASTDGDGVPCLDVPASSWLLAATHVRDVLHLDFFDWLSAVDLPDAEEPALEVVLHVAATPAPDGHSDVMDPADRGRRIRRVLLRTRVPDAEGSLPSLTAVWPGAAWHERETCEMFGLEFRDFIDPAGLGLRPLLLPEGFQGTPLRKSFVLASRVVKPWPGAKEPGESDQHGAPARRKVQPPGVPDPSWGPRPQPSADPVDPGEPVEPGESSGVRDGDDTGGRDTDA